MNYFSKMMAFLIAVLLLFIVPTFRTYWIIDQAVLKTLNLSTQEFVNNVRQKGFISKNMYEDFLRKISTTGYVYDIEMLHDKQVYYPNGKGNFIIASETFASKNILKDVFDKSKEYRYLMKKGDNFSLQLKNKGTSGSAVFMKLFGGSNSSMLFSRYGGMVSNEDY